MGYQINRCSKCGSKATLACEETLFDERYRVECDMCDNQTAEYDSAEGAVVDWNDSNKVICANCRDRVTYCIKNTPMHFDVNRARVDIVLPLAYCMRCGEEVYVPGLEDENAQKIADEYKRIVKNEQ